MRRRFWFRYAASGESTLTRKTRAAQYASERARATLAVTASTGDPGGLIKAIIQFAPRFMPGCVLVYVGDTGNKWSYFDKGQLPMLGVAVGGQGSMPDVVLYYPENHWRLLIECVMSHGPVDGKRHGRLGRLFAASKAGLIYLTAIPSHAMMARYVVEIS